MSGTHSLSSNSSPVPPNLYFLQILYAAFLLNPLDPRDPAIKCVSLRAHVLGVLGVISLKETASLPFSSHRLPISSSLGMGLQNPLSCKAGI